MTLAYARSILDTEMEAIRTVRDRLDHGFEDVLDVLGSCPGRIVTCGMGKAGLIARKVCTTLASTGTPSLFLHPAEALHGDLGMLRPGDVLVVFSNSGESREVVELLPFARLREAAIVAVTGDARSTLAAHADHVLCLGELGEACPLGLAPTATTTAMLALGDALALCLMKRQEFHLDDYARLHPGGALGRRALPIESVMRVNEAVSTVTPAHSVRDAILSITRARSGAAVVVDGESRVLGIFTDGDLRRHLEHDPDILCRPIAEVMTRPCVCVQTGQRAGEVLDVLKQKRIGEAPVVDQEGRLVGMADLKGIVASI